MTETEKAVTGLENLRDAILNDYIRETDQAVRTIDHVIELLKEQSEIVRCKCGWRYCPSCGARMNGVKWE